MKDLLIIVTVSLIALTISNLKAGTSDLVSNDQDSKSTYLSHP
jgi:hypothetical protein